MNMLLGLGANLGDPVKTLREALAALDTVPRTRLLRVSSFYRTAPVGYTDQDDFVNAVAEIGTALSPASVLGVCFGLEAACGRVRTFRNAPRTLDIDLLLAEGFTSDDERLIVPHPRMHERAFVLVPLSELFPDGICYGFDLNAAIRAVGTDGVTRLDLPKESAPF